VQLHQYMTEIAKRARCSPEQSASYLEKLEENGFSILESDREHPLRLDEIMATLGTPVEYQFGTKLSIEPIPGSKNSQFSSRGMPLHTDAVLNAGNDVTYIGMECLETPAEGGETLIASSSAFFALAPPELIDTLRDVTIEYRTRVDGYYKENPDGGHPTAPPIRVDPSTGRDRLYLALDDPDDPDRNYSAMVTGYSEEQSTELLRKVDEVLRRPEALYAHQWRVGEIMLLDNRRVLHGRAPFREGARRKLVRLSVA
jgi:L-tyrosine isonitrile desaturase/decarboxylase